MGGQDRNCSCQCRCQSLKSSLRMSASSWLYSFSYSLLRDWSYLVEHGRSIPLADSSLNSNLGKRERKTCLDIYSNTSRLAPFLSVNIYRLNCALCGISNFGLNWRERKLFAPAYYQLGFINRCINPLYSCNGVDVSGFFPQRSTGVDNGHFYPWTRSPNTTQICQFISDNGTWWLFYDLSRFPREKLSQSDGKTS